MPVIAGNRSRIRFDKKAVEQILHISTIIVYMHKSITSHGQKWTMRIPYDTLKVEGITPPGSDTVPTLLRQYLGHRAKLDHLRYGNTTLRRLDMYDQLLTT